MPLEKPFIKCYIFYTYNMLISYFNDFVNQQKRKTVRQPAFYILKIINRWFAGIITWNTYSVPVLFNILFDFFCKLNITAVPRSVSNNMCFNRISNQRKITYNVKQFMTRRLIGKTQFNII